MWQAPAGAVCVRLGLLREVSLATHAETAEARYNNYDRNLNRNQSSYIFRVLGSSVYA
jgi:hypothetical protein